MAGVHGLQEVDRLKRIVNEFSQFARMPRSVFRSEPLDELVHAAESLFRGLPPSIRLELELAPALPQVWVDREKISQVLLNLIKNAVEAMPEGGTLHVSCDNFSYCAKTAPVIPDLRPGDYIRIQLRDEGVGIGRRQEDGIGALQNLAALDGNESRITRAGAD